MLAQFENTEGARVFVVASNVTHVIPTAEANGPASICFVSGEHIKVTQTCEQVAASLGKVLDHQIVRGAAA